MDTPSIDIPTLVEELLAVDGLFDQRDAHIAVALYRLLADGKPVNAERLAAQAGRTASQTAEWLRGADRAERDQAGNIVAFQGFSLQPTQHLVEVDGRRLYAGCAADTLFLPELIGRAAQVRSSDPITGQPVSLSLQADGSVGDLQPATAVVSFAVPTTKIEAVAIPAACGPINFFATPESGHDFTTRVQGTFLLTIDQGMELARRINHTYGPAIRQ